MITEQPPTYKTTDGREFTDRAEAERHEALLTAKKRYEEARDDFSKMLALTERTADGELFDLKRVFDTYYVLGEGWEGFPAVREVDFIQPKFVVDERTGEVKILQRRVQEAAHRSDGWQEYRVGQLYRRESNARRAQLVAAEKWLAERAAEVAELRAKVRPAPPAAEEHTDDAD